MPPTQSLGESSRPPSLGDSSARLLRRRLADILPALFAFAGWWKLRELLYHTHWGKGPTIFALLLASIALVVAVPWLARLLSRAALGHATLPPAPAVEEEPAGAGAARRRAPRRSWLVGGALLAAALWASTDDVRQLPLNLGRDDVALLDIGRNTWAAAVHFFELGHNPYTHRAQLYRVERDPGVTVNADGGVEMLGVPYYYGYPYFPAMFLSYAPFRRIDPGPDSIRIGNAVWLALLHVGAGWLAFRLAPAGRRPQAAGLAALLLASSWGLGQQLFYFGITDVLIAVHVLFALVALGYRRHLLAGVLLGLAFSAKILPSLLIAAIVLVWLHRRQGLAPALAGFTLASAVVMLPFVLWSPAGFLSATILFYLTHHAAGDTTSLWYFLPQSLRFPFLALGGLAVLATTLWPWWSRSDDQRDLLRAIVVASLLFLAFNKMIHLNYQFAVVPLACVVLAADAMGTRRATGAGGAAGPHAVPAR